MSTRLYVASDDGSTFTKVYAGLGRKLTIPSRARPGKSDVISLNGREPEIFEYATDGATYSAGKVQGVPTMSDNYLVSPVNRVVVHHALQRLGLAGLAVDLATSLPVRMYYLKGQSNTRNEALIREKKTNLSRKVEPLNGDKPVVVIKQEVVPEAVAAYFDLVIKEDGRGEAVRDNEAGGQAIGIIDIGGRTTDFTVVSNGAVQMRSTGSCNVGMLNVRDRLRDMLTAEFQLDEVSDELLDRGMQDRRVRIRTREHDIGQRIDVGRREVAEQIKSYAMRYFGGAAELDRILFIGGGSMALADHLHDWFDGAQQKIADDPVFANARGMYKYLKYVAS